jgi:hypothetical protein
MELLWVKLFRPSLGCHIVNVDGPIDPFWWELLEHRREGLKDKAADEAVRRPDEDISTR